MLRIAHRGASALAPENTLAAVRRAVEFGIPWVEVDVQACADGLVVIHDDTLERTTDGHGPVATQPLAALRRLDAGGGERIPLPQEVLDLCRGRCAVNLELKGPDVA
ncbi:glycerophosphodiester phosphodiesterase, partial [Immundisolibacter sp.]|uniref:glycerophosphodiester phosphodiesterase n=1 Tax=Immundisolibacter sp. TaxID=1934948 RepID=UPI0035645332